MKVVNAGYKILTEISEGGIKELQHIEKIGRVCYKSEGLITEDGASARKFIRKLINNGHEAMLEHSSLSVLFTVDRGVTHELVRHRIMSFAQESTRYCNYSGDKFGNEITVIRPCFWSKDAIEADITGDTLSAYTVWQEACEQAEEAYLRILECGGTPQQARSVLPTSIKADITLTGNYREWRHFFKLRACGITGAPHPQMLEVTIPLLREVSGFIPIVFDDLISQI